MAQQQPASFTPEQCTGMRKLTLEQLRFLQRYLQEYPGARQQPMDMLRDGTWESWEPTQTA